jgi:hypothetical protein
LELLLARFRAPGEAHSRRIDLAPILRSVHPMCGRFDTSPLWAGDIHEQLSTLIHRAADTSPGRGGQPEHGPHLDGDGDGVVCE